MLTVYRQELIERLRALIERLHGLEHEPLVEVPPRRSLGDLAFPGALQLARELQRNPREIGAELAAELEPPDWVLEVKVEGPGFLNFYLDRSRIAADLLDGALLGRHGGDGGDGKVIVEHTNINPNKAAHIGHLRNAVLGDVLARVLSALGRPVEIQNYIDDTGVQLADVVVGFRDLRGLDAAAIAELPEPFDFLCWDLYAETSAWYGDDPDRRRLRTETLHALESGEGERAEIGRLVARRIVSRHLATMRRLGIRYDLLTHESAILELDFFTAAFEELEKRGAIQLEEEGKNAGCWVMPLADTPEFAGLEDADKVIVRSDGTVTYTGKDIAYQLWKFGLLGRDFGYRRWEKENVWQTVADGVDDPPAFGRGHRVINVIDARQSYLQKIVRAGLERLGYAEEAERSIHFAYEMVSLSPAAARQLGVLAPSDEADDDDTPARLEMSGRRGVGVKADDLIDQLEAKAREEISSRNRELTEGDLDQLARQIATAALRFFMVKATTTRVIAFDFDEALAFEGESGPYLQYSLVRERNIRRKLAEAGLADEVDRETALALASERWPDDLWDLVWTVALLPDKVAAAGDTLELSIVARLALDLAQKFNAAYHKHPILQEEDPEVRTVRLAATRIFARGLETLAELLGLPIPERM